MTFKILTDSFFNCLSLPKNSMLSIIGSGGKTSLMYNLGKKYALSSAVVCTTTTKLWEPTLDESAFLLQNDLQNFEMPQKCGMLTIAKQYCPVSETEKPKEKTKQMRRKVQGYSTDELESWWEQKPADLLFIEADGSAGRPLKAHAPKEPVIPQATNYVIGVVGLIGLGKALTQDSVWRPEIFATLSGLNQSDIITPHALAKVILHPSGLFERSPTTAKKILFLNGRDLPQAEAQALMLSRLILDNKECAIDIICIGSAQALDEECLCLIR
ncbi:selenium cofactor biosynthesis protein YqeC [Desulfovibrio litoralis]|uniref:Probable selenium-dependent hydroxylase accessory protein YqeC n=1 Tax=Desulfovibrio litoralis DSM 11393 TaxID=1121455 RepID=A0A1M7TJC7_9BACT|nr:selenium cofactor biosynthesis protein YqeC [Desulfovibrio litoralis]SHN70743.1 probable selenium-dependent hydroxylase accessory protein YqeC [Desulfovibrio litoralis DSM 11393]